MKTVFHHHGAGFVETPDEISWLLEGTDEKNLGLVFDTGHYMLGGGDALEGLIRFQDRIQYVHFKDFTERIHQKAILNDWDYFQMIEGGIFCELGKGDVPFETVVMQLQKSGYSGWVVVEQDVLPGMGLPKESAIRNRQYLRSLGL